MSDETTVQVKTDPVPGADKPGASSHDASPQYTGGPTKPDPTRGTVDSDKSQRAQREQQQLVDKAQREHDEAEADLKRKRDALDQADDVLKDHSTKRDAAHIDVENANLRLTQARTTLTQVKGAPQDAVKRGKDGATVM